MVIGLKGDICGSVPDTVVCTLGYMATWELLLKFFTNTLVEFLARRLESKSSAVTGGARGSMLVAPVFSFLHETSASPLIFSSSAVFKREARLS